MIFISRLYLISGENQRLPIVTYFIFPLGRSWAASST